MKVLVTGANGFIGCLLVRQLLEHGYVVRCFILEGESPNALEDLPVEIVYGNVCNPDTLYDPVSGVDYIYHLAAVKQSWDESLFYEVNVQGTKNLVAAIVKVNRSLKKCLFVSTQAAAGPSTNRIPLTEEDPCHPVDHYGKSKRLVEEYMLEYCDEIPLTIVRPTSIYGPENLGPSLTTYIISASRLGILPMVVPYARTIHPIHVRDVVDGLILAAECERAIGQIYFLTSPEASTWEEFVRLCFKARNQRGWLVPIPGLAVKLGVYGVSFYRWLIGRSYRGIHDQLKYLSYVDWLCSGEKARKDLGFEPKISLEEGLKETVIWYDKMREDNTKI